MKLERAELVWLRALAAELDGASRVSRGGRVFFDQVWIDGVVRALRTITNGEKAQKQ